VSYPVHIDGRELDVDIIGRRPVLRLAVAGQQLSVTEAAAAAGAFELRVDGESYRGWRYSAGDEVYVRLLGRTFIVGRPRDETGGKGADKAHDEVHADMPGVVVAVHCEPGAVVRSGDKLVTLESMKLQITVVAHREGRIEAVHVRANGSFERGALLVSFAPELAP
jgi:acetyl/propionyl-CoA carboxylase alpha subunit